MGRQHLSDCLDERLRAQGVQNMLSVRQQKTGKPLVLPVRPNLQAVIDATPSEHLTFLVTPTGKPYSPNHFSETFRKWCDAAGLPKHCTVHGLRKAGCRCGAEDGWSANELAAWTGHASLRELERYTRAADQARLARNALAKTITRTKDESKVSNSTGV
jgi:integrase